MVDFRKFRRNAKGAREVYAGVHRQAAAFGDWANDNPVGVTILGILLGVTVIMTASHLGFLDGFITPYYEWMPDTTVMRVLFVTLSGVIGFAIGWFLSPSGRIAQALIGGALIGMLATVAVMDHGVVGWGLATACAVVAFMAGLGYWARNFFQRLSETPTTLGSARWAKTNDITDAGLIGLDGFRLGFWHDRTYQLPMSYQGDRHMLTVAPTRSHKGVSAIIPNLLTYEGSVMVIDPKGENAMITAKRRQEMGQEVHVVDPWGITGMDSARFNPLDWLVKGDVDIGDNAMLIADAIIMMQNSSEKFWDEEAKALLLGVILYVALEPSEKHHRHLGRVRELLTLDGEELTKLFKNMLQSPHRMVRSAGARCLQKEEKLLSNVMASVQAQTHFLDSQRIIDSLSQSDFKFEDLKTKPMSIYLVLPSDRLNAYGRWLRLLIQQALTVNARNIETKPDKSVLFILDEMPALGHLTMVEQAFGLMAGYGMQLWGICQDASQLKRIYGDGWETFVSNAGVIQYFGSRDKMTAEYFSSLCGVTTVWNFSTALARAVGITKSNDYKVANSQTTTTTTTDTATGTQRRLAYADELMRLDKTRQLLLIENMPPIMGHKMPWFEDENLKTLGVNLQAQN